MTDDTDDLRTSTVEESAPKATTGEFTHANPYTGQPFGEVAFDRSPAVAADGGERDGGPGTPGEPDDESDVDPAAEDAGGPATMRDVDHEHPHAEADEANRVFRRGHDDGDT